jgi:hypothetical protein
MDIIDKIITECKEIEYTLNVNIKWDKTVMPPLQKLKSIECSYKTYCDVRASKNAHSTLEINEHSDVKLLGIPLKITRDPLISKKEEYYRPYFDNK